MLFKMTKKVKDLLNFPLKAEGLRHIEQLDLKHPKVLAGRTLANLNNHIFKSITRLSDVEFQVYSQWGDDGIIQWLIHNVNVDDPTFVEFGVQDYTESNTRFLLVNNNWEGLVLDGSAENIQYIKRDRIYHYHHLHAKCAFITAENINELISDRPFDRSVGILSIDIDGNDYWVWKALDVIQPAIVISEYNAVFGLNPWTIPYKNDFVRLFDDPKTVFFGASLQSLCDLAEEKGYFFVGCNSAGNNAFFVRKDKIGNLKPVTAKEGYEFAKFREAKDSNGERISEGNRSKDINGMTVFNTRTGTLEKIDI
jgi:hypothetical protein